jgi:adenylate cyclase
MADRLPRKLAAILYADVAGYSRLTGEDEDATHVALSEYLDLISTTINSHGGQVMHYAGDAVLAKFEAVVDALSGAIAIQNELQARNQDLPHERKVRFRIGVNIGDVIEDRGDIYGDGVNVAARLESLAEPGGVCISDAVRTAIGKKLPYQYVSIGEQRVKNIEEPVRAYRVAFEFGTTGKSPLLVQSENADIVEQSIAVMPFDNLGNDNEQEYFVDGLTEDIITELSKSPDPLVVSRNSTFAYKGVATDARELGEKLGVHYLLEGSVRKSSNRLRVNAQLIETATGHHVWAERYDRDLKDIFVVQDEIVESIIGALGGAGGKLDQLARARAVRKETENLAAYDCFLRGREYLNRYRARDKEFSKAREMFERAIELDPEFHRAYLGLAWFHIMEVKFGWSDDPRHSLQQANELAQHAVGLDRPSAWSHMILGYICTCSRQFKQAEAYYEQALALNPSDVVLLMFMADTWCYLGRPKEAIEFARKAIRLSTNSPDWHAWNLAFAYYTNQQYQEAQSVLERVANPGDARRLLAATYAKLGQLEKARAVAKEFLEDHPHFSIARWAVAEPYANPADLEDYVEGMRRAGLPE